MKYGVTAPPEEGNKVFSGIFMNTTKPDEAAIVKPVKRRDKLRVKCKEVETAIKKERASTDLLLSRLTLHLTKLRRQARLQAELQDSGVANKIRKEFNDGNLIAGLLRDVVLPCSSKERSMAVNAIDGILHTKQIPSAESNKVHRRKIRLERAKSFEEQTSTGVCNIEFRRAMVPNLADKHLEVSAKLGKRVATRGAARGMEIGEAKDSKHAKPSIKTGYSDTVRMDVLLNPDALSPSKPELASSGKRIVSKGDKKPHYHKSEALPRSVFDDTHEGFAVRHAIASIDDRAGMKRLQAASIFNPKVKPPYTEEPYQAVSIDLPANCLDPRPLGVEPKPPAGVSTSCRNTIDARRAQALSGSNNVIPLGL